VRTLLLLVAIAVLITPVAGGGTSSPPLPTETAVVQTGAAPCGAVADAEALWVSVYGGTLLRIDPRGRVTRRIRIGPSACSIALEGSYIWAARDRAAELVRVDRGTGRLRRVKVAA